MIQLRNMLASNLRTARLIAGSFLISALGLLSFAPFTFAAALSSTDVQPASLTAGSTSTVTVTFTTATTIPANGKIKVTFGSGFTITGAGPVSCSSMDGTFGPSISGQTVIITRNNDGTPETAGAQTCTIGNIVNPGVSGSTGTYTIQTTDSSDVELDIDAAVAADTIIAGSLSGTNVQPASLVAGATTTVTVSFGTVNSIPSTGKIKVTFGSGFNVSGAVGGTCSTMDGSFATSAASQTVTITRSGGSSQSASTETCTIGGIVNPAVSGSTGTYTIGTTDSSDNFIDADGAVAADTITAGALSSTNVQPGVTKIAVNNTVTVSFTTANPIPSTGKIKVTFGSGFNVASAASATCSTMDGSFATGVSGQVVTITRSGGSSQSAAAETCTIGNIINPYTAGSTGTYTITTTNSSDATIDTNTSVTADTMTSSSSHAETPAATYAVTVTAPNGGESVAPGATMITWSSTQTNGSAMTAVNLYYSVDGGSTWTTIATGVTNDGSYEWSVPDVDTAEAMAKVEGTDLSEVLATDSSDAVFTITGTETVTTDDTTDTTDDGTTDSSNGLTVGEYIKTADSSSVYQVDTDADGNLVRRVFMNETIFFTWQDDFSNVETVSSDVMSQISLGGMVLPKAGVVLVKFESVAAVYAIEGTSTIRWVTSEAVAKANYGSAWADYVIDLPPTMYHYFTAGDDVTDAEGTDTSDMKKRVDLHD